MFAISSFMLVTGFCFWWLILKIKPERVSISDFQKAILLVLAVLAMHPFSLYSPGLILRGFTGDFSVTTCLLIVNAIVFQFRSQHFFQMQEKWFLLVMLAMIGAVFYPLSLGASSYDPYAAGFGSYWLVFGLVGIGGYSLFRQWYANCITLSLVMLAWSAHASESTNLWDYMIDPWVWLYALGSCVVAMWRQISSIHEP